MLKGKRDAIRKRRVSTKHIKQKKETEVKDEREEPEYQREKDREIERSLRCTYTGSDETEKRYL